MNIVQRRLEKFADGRLGGFFATLDVYFAYYSPLPPWLLGIELGGREMRRHLPTHRRNLGKLPQRSALDSSRLCAPQYSPP